MLMEPTTSRHNRIYGAHVTRARQLASLSKNAFAKLMEVDRKTVTRWEKGTQEPRPSTRQLIADRLNQPLAAFYDETILDAAGPDGHGHEEDPA